MSNIPKDSQFIYFRESSIFHEGDERSRTNPGHGYPAYTEKVLTPVFIKNEEELKRRLKLERFTPEVFRLTPVEVRMEIVIKVDEK